MQAGQNGGVGLNGRITMRGLSLSRKLILGGMAIVLIPMLGIGSFTIVRSMNALSGISQEMVVQAVEKLTVMVSALIEEELSTTKGLSALESVRNLYTKVGKEGREQAAAEIDEVNRELLAIMKSMGDQYSGAFVTDAKGIALAGILSDGSTKGYLGMDISDRDYFKEVKQNPKPNVAPIVRSKVTKAPVMIAYSPIKSEKGEFLGIMALTSKVDFLIDVIASNKVGKTGYCVMLDAQGAFIAHPKKELILEATADKMPGVEELGRRMVAQEKGLLEMRFEGAEKIAAFAPVGIRSWSIAAVQHKQEFQDIVNAFRNQAVLIGCVFLVAAMILVYFFSRNLSMPISRATSSLSQGAQQVASASTQIASASQQLAEGASEQAAAIEEISSSLEEMSSMTVHNADNAENSHRIVQESGRHFEDAGNAMKELADAMQEITSASEETSKIIRTIDEIAFQTNLLALNAAVEAARAGEAGAGFAVVADEVRNLAMRAADAAKNTAQLIESTVKKVRDGSGIVQKADESFRRVTSDAARVGELVGEIAAATREQAEGIRQVNRAVTDMDRVIQQNAANAEESASAAEEMSAQADNMHDVVSGLARMVGVNDGGGRVKKSGKRRPSASPAGVGGKGHSGLPAPVKAVARESREVGPGEVLHLKK